MLQCTVSVNATPVIDISTPAGADVVTAGASHVTVPDKCFKMAVPLLIVSEPFTVLEPEVNVPVEETLAATSNLPESEVAPADNVPVMVVEPAANVCVMTAAPAAVKRPVPVRIGPLLLACNESVPEPTSSVEDAAPVNVRAPLLVTAVLESVKAPKATEEPERKTTRIIVEAFFPNSVNFFIFVLYTYDLF